MARGNIIVLCLKVWMSCSYMNVKLQGFDNRKLEDVFFLWLYGCKQWTNGDVLILFTWKFGGKENKGSVYLDSNELWWILGQLSNTSCYCCVTAVSSSPLEQSSMFRFTAYLREQNTEVLPTRGTFLSHLLTCSGISTVSAKQSLQNRYGLHEDQ